MKSFKVYIHLPTLVSSLLRLIKPFIAISLLLSQLLYHASYMEGVSMARPHSPFLCQ